MPVLKPQMPVCKIQALRNFNIGAALSHHTEPLRRRIQFCNRHRMDQDNNLSHDEIWDDSALVNSWNQALDEYKVSDKRQETAQPHGSRDPES